MGKLFSSKFFCRNGSIRVEPDTSIGSIDQARPKSQSRIFIIRLIVPVGVPYGPYAIFHPEKNDSRILSFDHRVDLPKIGKYRVHFTKQIPERIDKMNAVFIHQETWIFPEIGLSWNVGILSPTVPHPRTEIDTVRCSNHTRIQELLDLTVPGLKTPILMHHEPGFLRGNMIHNLTGFIHGGCQWFLADDMDSPVCRLTTHLKVCFRWSDDIHDVGLFPVQHFYPVRVMTLNSALLHNAGCFLFVTIAQCSHFHFRDSAPCPVLESGKISGSYSNDLVFYHR